MSSTPWGDSERDYYQSMFRVFIKSLRDEKSWSKEDLADELGVSKPLIEKLESRCRPSKVVENIMYLKRFSDLKGIGVDSFVSIVLGKLNEEAESGGAFAQEIARDIAELSNTAQVNIKSGCQHPKGVEAASEVFAACAKSLPTTRRFYQLIADLSDKQRKLLLEVGEAMLEGSGK